MSKKKIMLDLATVIRLNPGCVAVVDNDDWVLYSRDPDDLPDDEDADKYAIADADSVISKGDGGYGSGNCYGGDLLQALAEIVGMKVKSV